MLGGQFGPKADVVDDFIASVVWNPGTDASVDAVCRKQDLRQRGTEFHRGKANADAASLPTCLWTSVPSEVRTNGIGLRAKYALGIA